MQTFTHPAKWRDTVDPFSLSFHAFQPTEILGYPAARNDVFHLKGLYEGREITAYLKAARVKEANIENEVALLRQLHLPCIPRVLDTGENPSFVVTEELPGLRLSVLAGKNEDMASLSYMEAYGETLARFHQLTPTAGPMALRRFHQPPPQEMLSELQLSHLKDFFAAVPQPGDTVFCHGDFHYANLLWKDHRISAILDFELSGYGDRNVDIAWAIFRRHGQTFMKTDEETQRFLAGYAKHNSFDPQAVTYYMAQFYVYFMSFAGDDTEYLDFARAWLKRHCGA